jgi:hypothetical protein
MTTDEINVSFDHFPVGEPFHGVAGPRTDPTKTARSAPPSRWSASTPPASCAYSCN